MHGLRISVQEVELEGMADAARLVNRRNVRHDEVLVISQLPRYPEAPDREANGVVEAPQAARMYSVIIPEATR